MNLIVQQPQKLLEPWRPGVAKQLGWRPHFMHTAWWMKITRLDTFARKANLVREIRV